MNKSKIKFKVILNICCLFGLFFGLNLSVAATPSEAVRGALPVPGTSQTSNYLTLSQHGTVLENDKVSLQWSNDGNLSIRFYNKEVVWESKTGGQGNMLAFQESDGKLIIKNSAGQVIWTTSGTGGHTLQLHLHRNLVLLNSNNQIIWETNTSIPDLKGTDRIAVLQNGEKPLDFMVPYNATAKYLYLHAEGGDGGKRQVKEAWGNTRFTVNGGAGATVKANFEIGTGDNMIPPGAILRFIIGKKGETRTAQTTAGSPGGAGTAVLVKKPVAGDWHLLMVAGGGGGAYSDCCTVKREGHQANTGKNGGQGGGSGGTGGTDGSYGREGSKHEWTGTGGGGAYEDNDWDTGQAGWKGARTGSSGSYVYHRSVLPTGGSANTDGASDNYVKGAWGFGGGGNGDTSGGGGGGYSGGGSGKSYYPGGGGGSYLNETFVRSKFMQANGTTNDPEDGFVEYELSDAPVNFTITFALDKNTDKCIHVKDGSGTNSANVELWDCMGTDAQKWVMDGLMVKFLPNMSKCLEIQGSTPDNGANVELWTCNSNTNAQKWVYDGVKRLVRSARNLDKYLDLVNG